MADSDIILGIDLGSSFCTVAAWANGRVHLVPDARGEPCIPSVVHFPERGAPVVGAPALRLRKIDPANTISGVKRLLGRDMSSAEVRIFASHSAVDLRAAPNGTAVLTTRAGDYTAPQIASILFTHLRELAEARLGTKAKKAVITLPVSATAAVEAATIQAAERAGLEVVHTLCEPVAGAISSQVDRFVGTRRVLVYDFGGGTFDVTVLNQRNDELLPLAMGGDPCLGGDDLDHQFAELVAAQVWRNAAVDLHRDVVRWDRLIRECERTKRALSAHNEAALRLPEAYSAHGAWQDLALTVRREDVDGPWGPLVARSLKITAETMLASETRPDKLDLVLLVGGTTFTPLVKRMVEKVLGRPACHEGDPQTAVARGAAIAGARRVLRAA